MIKEQKNKFLCIRTNFNCIPHAEDKPWPEGNQCPLRSIQRRAPTIQPPRPYRDEQREERCTS